MRHIILLLFMLIVLMYMREGNSATLDCKVGHNDDKISVVCDDGLSTCHKSFESSSMSLTFHVEDVYSLNPADDYLEMSDGKHSFTQPLYCERR